jgi:hypothetical protein
MPVKRNKKKLIGKTDKKKLQKPTTFFNPETDPNPDRKPTFKQKSDPDPDRLLKVNPAQKKLTFNHYLCLKLKNDGQTSPDCSQTW